MFYIMYDSFYIQLTNPHFVLFILLSAATYVYIG